MGVPDSHQGEIMIIIFFVKLLFLSVFKLLNDDRQGGLKTGIFQCLYRCFWYVFHLLQKIFPLNRKIKLITTVFGERRLPKNYKIN